MFINKIAIVLCIIFEIFSYFTGYYSLIVLSMLVYQAMCFDECLPENHKNFDEEWRSHEHTSATSNKQDDTRLDIAAKGFWVPVQKAFFDVRVFNPIARRYRNMKITKAFDVNEKEKKRTYNQRVLEVEHGSFTPIVFTAMGGMGRETNSFYKRLSELLCEKRDDHISIITTWVRRKVIFALMRSVILCLRGSRIP